MNFNLLCFGQIIITCHRSWKVPLSNIIVNDISRRNPFLDLRGKLKWTISPRCSSSPSGLLSVHWWRLCEVSVDLTPPPPLRHHCDGKLRTCAFIFHLSVPRRKRSSYMGEARGKSSQKSWRFERLHWQPQHWPGICEWQKDPSSTFPFLAALEVKATPNGHWLDELSFWLGWEKL